MVRVIITVATTSAIFSLLWRGTFLALFTFNYFGSPTSLSLEVVVNWGYLIRIDTDFMTCLVMLV